MNCVRTVAKSLARVYFLLLVAILSPVAGMKLGAAEAALVRNSQTYRYLILVDSSYSMHRCWTTVRYAVHDLIAGGFNGNIRPGDGFGVWIFNHDVYKYRYPFLNWVPDLNQALANSVGDLLKKESTENDTRLDLAMVEATRVARKSDLLTIVLISDETSIKGTPFDAAINAHYAEHKKDMHRRKLPFITSLLVVDGNIVRWTVSEGVGTINLPENAEAPPAIAEATTKPAVTPTPTPTPAPAPIQNPVVNPTVVQNSPAPAVESKLITEPAEKKPVVAEPKSTPPVAVAQQNAPPPKLEVELSTPPKPKPAVVDEPKPAESKPVELKPAPIVTESTTPKAESTPKPLAVVPAENKTTEQPKPNPPIETSTPPIVAPTVATPKATPTEPLRIEIPPVDQNLQAAPKIVVAPPEQPKETPPPAVTEVKNNPPVQTEAPDSKAQTPQPQNDVSTNAVARKNVTPPPGGTRSQLATAPGAAPAASSQQFSIKYLVTGAGLLLVAGGLFYFSFAGRRKSASPSLISRSMDKDN